MLCVVCYYKVIFSINYFMYIYIWCKRMLYVYVFIIVLIDIVFVGSYRND